MINQIAVDIKPEFDKFIENPYPRVANMINTSRGEKEESSYINTQKSSHPFAKYANPLSRANINPNDDNPREALRTDCTIRTFNENENSFNPFNK